MATSTATTPSLAIFPATDPPKTVLSAEISHAQQAEDRTSSPALLGRTLHSAAPTISHASGLYITLTDGRVILDASAGAAVACIGHSDPRVAAAVADQMGRFSYANSMAFAHDPGEALARRLVDSTRGCMAKAYFVGSGSEAVEAALKLARQYFVERGEPRRTAFIARLGSYHGTTLGALGVGGHASRRKPFGGLFVDGGKVSACNGYRGRREGEGDAGYVRRLADELDRKFRELGPDRVCAFVAEPVVGAALGCVPAVPGYFRAVKQVCRRHGALLILDEVMCGMGRCGTYHAWQHEGKSELEEEEDDDDDDDDDDSVSPDIQTIGKGLGGGYVPLAGLLVSAGVVDALRRGSGAFAHGQTFQAHPVACAAAAEVQRIVAREALVERAARAGRLLGSGLRRALGAHEHVGDVRGRGLFWGVEFVADKASKRAFAAAAGVAMGVHAKGLELGISLYPGTGSAEDGESGDHVIVSPPLNVTDAEVDRIVELTRETVYAYFGGGNGIKETA